MRNSSPRQMIFEINKMPLFVTSLNSGSNGNCYYVGTENEAVLIDAGISCREIEKRLAGLDLSMANVKALFISHEHIDHIRGAETLARKYSLPIFITAPTLNKSGFHIRKNIIHSFRADEPVVMGNLRVTAFEKNHDAVDPYSFVVEGNGVKVGVITDIGIACKRVIHYFKQCHACFLESNYDEQMLEEGGYPLRLKNRIRGGNGHLSNAKALDLFVKHRPGFMSHLFLSHLSKNNNSPALVNELFNKHAGETEIVIASRDESTKLYTIRSQENSIPIQRLLSRKQASVQMKMFD